MWEQPLGWLDITQITEHLEEILSSIIRKGNSQDLQARPSAVFIWQGELPPLLGF